MLDPMAQGEEVEQEILVVEGEQFFPPQMDPEPEMGAAAAEAAVYDTSPSLLRNPPPIPAETAQPSAPDVSQRVTILLAEIRKNARDFMDGMDVHTKAFRSEMQSLQAGIRAFASDEMRTAGGKMATPHAGTNELGGECNGCQARGGGG